ncbi:hypothetical protein ACQ5SK_27495 [Bradyrhizobium japonicum]
MDAGRAPGSGATSSGASQRTAGCTARRRASGPSAPGFCCTARSAAAAAAVAHRSREAIRRHRASLGDFARSGDARDLRRGLGHYIRNGYGGSNPATQRFGATAQTAGWLGYTLYSTASGAADAPIDAAVLAGRSTEEIATAIIEAVRPVDGTQDAEAERAAMHDAMSELLKEFPEADLLNLSDVEREFVIEKFTAIDVARRFELDVGKHLLERARPQRSQCPG